MITLSLYLIAYGTLFPSALRVVHGLGWRSAAALGLAGVALFYVFSCSLSVERAERSADVMSARSGPFCSGGSHGVPRGERDRRGRVGGSWTAERVAERGALPGSTAPALALGIILGAGAASLPYCCWSVPKWAQSSWMLHLRASSGRAVIRHGQNRKSC